MIQRTRTKPTRVFGYHMECDVSGCNDKASFELDIPWDENECVCAGHARVRSRKDGIVPNPLDSADDALPDGASDRSNGT